MRSSFLLAGLGLAAISAPAFAVTYLSVEQAQAAMFPGATFTNAATELTSAQAAAISARSGVPVEGRSVHAWRASDGGWFIVDSVMGKHDFITYALALDARGDVKGLEILTYRESYGYQIRNAAWRRQFVGAHPGSALRLGHEIANISGATLSSRHVTNGVRRLLATYALVLRSA